MLGHPRGAEVVRHAANGNDERVISDSAGWYQEFAIGAANSAKQDFLRLAVQTYHLAALILEMMPIGLCQIVEFMFARVEAASGGRMNQRLP
ncbi:hypothetical protein BOSP111201_04745 [Bordetella sputigena]